MSKERSQVFYPSVLAKNTLVSLIFKISFIDEAIYFAVKPPSGSPCIEFHGEIFLVPCNLSSIRITIRTIVYFRPGSLRLRYASGEDSDSRCREFKKGTARSKRAADLFTSAPRRKRFKVSERRFNIVQR